MASGLGASEKVSLAFLSPPPTEWEGGANIGPLVVVASPLAPLEPF